MGVSFTLTVHITLLSIILFQLVVEGASYLLPACAFLHEDSTNHQRREDDQMWDISPAGWWWTSCGWLIITIIISHYSTWHYPKSSQWMLRQSIVKAFTVHCFWISKHTGPPNKDTTTGRHCSIAVDLSSILLSTCYFSIVQDSVQTPLILDQKLIQPLYWERECIGWPTIKSIKIS